MQLVQVWAVNEACDWDDEGRVTERRITSVHRTEGEAVKAARTAGWNGDVYAGLLATEDGVSGHLILTEGRFSLPVPGDDDE